MWFFLCFKGFSQYEAFSFQEDGFLDKQSNKEWAQYDHQKFPELERLTVCVWVKLHFHRIHNQVWSYCALKNFILVCSGLSKYNLKNSLSVTCIFICMTKNFELHNFFQLWKKRKLLPQLLMLLLKRMFHMSTSFIHGTLFV